MCLTPVEISAKKKSSAENMYEKINVPCGRCPECYARRISGWSFRLMQEGKKMQSSHFITLTYGNRNVPFNSRGKMVLDKRDLQLFFKRLRKAHESKQYAGTIKYFAVGEYGGRTLRPHYHIILFGAEIELIQNAWKLGQVHYGEVTGASIGYCLKYMMKTKIKDDDRPREFQLSSKGLGASYVTNKSASWHLAKTGERMYLTTEQGKKIAMPRYYKEMIYTEEMKHIIQYHARKKILEKEKKQQQQMKKDKNFLHNYSEGVKYQFRKMEKSALLNKNKI